MIPGTSQVAADIQHFVEVILGRIGSKLLQLSHCQRNVGVSAQYNKEKRSKDQLELLTEFGVNFILFWHWNIASWERGQCELAVLHPKALQHLIKIQDLIELDLKFIMSDAHAQKLLSDFLIVAFPLLIELSLEKGNKLLVLQEEHYIIYVNNDHTKAIIQVLVEEDTGI